MQTLQLNIESILKHADGHWAITVHDLQTNIGFGLNEHERYKAQSMIKLPIMAAVFAAYEQGKLSLSELVPLKQEDIVGGAGVLQHLSVGVKLTIYDLITLMIIQSDNTATNMLVDLVGFEAIETMMARIGMNQSCFRKKLVIYPAVENDVENYVTAHDIQLFLIKLAKGQIISGYSSRQMISIMKHQQYRNALPFYFPDPINSSILGVKPKWELAHKTGWDTGYQHDAGLLYVGDHCMAMTVLSKDVDHVKGLLTIAEIGKAVFDYVNETEVKV